MQKTKLQSFIFTVLMAFVMVYAMVCYNIALNMGGMSNQVFLLAFHEMPIMWPVAIILELFVVEKLAVMLAFRIVRPTDRPAFIQLVICTMIVCLMCPTMSLIATILFKDAGSEVIAKWFETLVFNFPMALAWQIFFGGPLVRLIYSKVIEPLTSRRETEESVGMIAAEE